jgi:Lrp/AsnC family leucine-responsive transcriptional regulator
MYFRLRDCTPKKEAEIFEFIQSRPNIAYLAKMTGPYDGVCLVLCRSAVQMAQFLEPLMQRYGTFIRSKEFALFLTTHRFNQKFIWSAEERKDWHYPEPLGSYALDTVDSRIIEILSAQARRPLTEIAQIVGVDAKVVKYRLRKLEQDGIVLAYVSSPNFERLGLRFVQLNMALKDPTARKAILQYFDSTDKCLYAMEMIGRYDLAVELHVSSDKELEAVVDGFRQKFVEKIQDYDVSVIDREFVVEWGPVKMGKK